MSVPIIEYTSGWGITLVYAGTSHLSIVNDMTSGDYSTANVVLTRATRDKLVETLQGMTFPTWVVYGEIRSLTNNNVVTYSDAFMSEDEDEANQWAEDAVVDVHGAYEKVYEEGSRIYRYVHEKLKMEFRARVVKEYR